MNFCLLACHDDFATERNASRSERMNGTPKRNLENLINMAQAGRQASKQAGRQAGTHTPHTKKRDRTGTRAHTHTKVLFFSPFSFCFPSSFLFSSFHLPHFTLFDDHDHLSLRTGHRTGKRHQGSSQRPLRQYVLFFYSHSQLALYHSSAPPVQTLIQTLI